MKIIVVEGLDCSGKTTYINNRLLKTYPYAQVVSYEGIRDVTEKITYMGEALFEVLKDNFLGQLDDDSVIIFDRGIASTYFYDRHLTGDNTSKHFIVKAIKKMFRSLPDLECHVVSTSVDNYITRLEAKQRDEIEDKILELAKGDPLQFSNLIVDYRRVCKEVYQIPFKDLLYVIGGI